MDIDGVSAVTASVFTFIIIMASEKNPLPIYQSSGRVVKAEVFRGTAQKRFSFFAPKTHFSGIVMKGSTRVPLPSVLLMLVFNVPPALSALVYKRSFPSEEGEITSPNTRSIILENAFVPVSKRYAMLGANSDGFVVNKILFFVIH